MDTESRLASRLAAVLLVASVAACGGGGGGGTGGGSAPPVQTTPVTISPNTATVEAGSTQAFSASGGSGGYVFAVSSGIGSIEASGTYSAPHTTGAATITVTDSQGRSASSTVQIVAPAAPTAPTLSLSASIKTLHFTWTASTGIVAYYRILKNPDGVSGFTQVGTDIPASARTESVEISVHREDWVRALYVVSACNAGGCTDSQAQSATSLMLSAIGYFKPSNALGGGFGAGNALALSADGTTLAVGAPLDRSVGNTINGPGTQSGGFMNGAAYVFRKSAAGWALEAFIKSSNNVDQHRFGESLSLSGDGNTLVVGAPNESGGSLGVDGDKFIPGPPSGAAYVFVRNGSQWTERNYLKASNAEAMLFGRSVSISRDGSTIVVGAPNESCGGAGIDNALCFPSQAGSGASYVYARSGDSWVVQAYVKASNAGSADQFGESVSLSADGNTLLIGAPYESSAATGVNGDQQDDSLSQAGAAYVFTRLAGSWTQSAYVKASDPQSSAIFGYVVRVNDAGTRFAISAPFRSNAGVARGAIYVFDVANGAWAEQARLAPTSSQPFYVTPGFGSSLAFDASGDQLIVGDENEQSAATGIGGDRSDESSIGAGAAYLFARTTGGWQLEKYIKASNTGGSDFFGSSAACSADGSTIALGARSESSSALGVAGDQTNNDDPVSGAVYLY